MKNVLNKFGYASRPVIIGVVLGIIALALSAGNAVGADGVMRDLKTVTSYTEQAVNTDSNEESKEFADISFSGGTPQRNIPVTNNTVTPPTNQPSPPTLPEIELKNLVGTNEDDCSNKENKSITCQVKRAKEKQDEIKNRMWWMYGAALIIGTLMTVAYFTIPMPWLALVITALLIIAMTTMLLILVSVLGLVAELGDIGEFSGVTQEMLKNIRGHAWGLFAFLNLMLLFIPIIILPIVLGTIGAAVSKLFIDTSGANKSLKAPDNGEGE